MTQVHRWPSALSGRPRLILDRLAESDGPVDRWDLVDEITPGATDDTVLRTYVSRLRSALGAGAIATSRGLGYELTQEGRAAYARLKA
jgi:DNA-binding response OmpR family regulator